MGLELTRGAGRETCLPLCFGEKYVILKKWETI